MPTADADMEKTPACDSQRVALILCFDGTGNHFQGNESDTNIVKIYSMLKKHTPGQYHYYQPGIGTYTQGQSSGSPHSGTRSKIWSALDQGFGLTFVDHVVGGYKFIMRYFQERNDIYIFGFSRGAYTARLLTEMIWRVGLLSKGNEEMVHFAWQTFSKFQQNVGISEGKSDEEIYMDKFRNTFCRPHVQVHFLGLFDCVNSVGQFEIPMCRKSYKYIAQPAAKHIRHAVSVHERRLKFKPALFLYSDEALKKLDLKELWFSGNHGDVGGGWPHSNPDQKHLLSDTPLLWMINESLTLTDSESKLVYDADALAKLEDREGNFLDAVLPAAVTMRNETSKPHDMLKRGCGASWYQVFLWWILELLPFFTRLELEHNKWVPRYWPPNFGAPRDIPEIARIHESVDKLFELGLLEEMPVKGGDNSHFTNTKKHSDPLNVTQNQSGADPSNVTGHEKTTPSNIQGNMPHHETSKAKSGI